MVDFKTILENAWLKRQPLIGQLHAEETNSYRLLHGTVEGVSGLTIDRYGDVLLIQSFHQSISAAQLTQIECFYHDKLPLQQTVYNDRSLPGSRYKNALPEEQQKQAKERHTVSEMGVKFVSRARHRGIDPLLFLDLRSTRRYINGHCRDKTMLNLFAYTCGAGVGAGVNGAKHVSNVDFAESSLGYGKENALLNNLNEEKIAFIQDDFFAVVRQFAGLSVGGRRQKGRSAPQAKKRQVQQFDIVLLDPPRWAKSKFGTVDLVRDYGSVFKPALLTVAEGGELVCTNNVAGVAESEWLDLIQRSAKKAGRPARNVEIIRPEADFPSFDGAPPLKVAVLSV